MKHPTLAAARSRLIPVLLCWMVAASPGLAVDGVIEINQARALAGTITPGDAAGFPVTLSETGSYRLTGNLTVPDENTTAIEIAADHVTLDLNGFGILGPGTATGTGFGIKALTAQEHTVVINGTVRGMGSSGMNLKSFSRVERVDASHNGYDGIRVQSGSLVLSSIAYSNGWAGIAVGFDSTISFCVARGNHYGIYAEADSTIFNNTTNENVSHGIYFIGGSTVRGNTSVDNGGDGFHGEGIGSAVIENTSTYNDDFQLTLGIDSGYVNNVLRDPSNDFVSGGTQMGTNLCNGSPCP